ncbi:replication-relaxation family protein [Spirillospora sp. CA-253888]
MTARRAPRRPRSVSSDLALTLAARLTDRDRSILDLVHQHRTFTTDQLTALFFHSLRPAQRRLAELEGLQTLLRFQPRAMTGSISSRWALGPAGAYALAAWQGIEVKDLGYRPDRIERFLMSQHLAHQLGVNDFFVRLRVLARSRGECTELAQWWPELRCARVWGAHARPDAFGRWYESLAGERVGLDFFLEHDTGTEPLSRVVAKLSGYISLAQDTGTYTPVLFWLPNPTREANLRRLLGVPQVPVATAVHSTAGDGPAGAVWLPAGVTGPRRRLAALADAWATPDRPRDLRSDRSWDLD